MKLKARSSPTLVPRIARCIFVTLLFSRFSEEELVVKWCACLHANRYRKCVGNPCRNTLLRMLSWAPGGATQRSFIREDSAERSTPYPLVYHFLREKVSPFVYLLLTNGTPFTYLVKNFASLLTVKMHWLLNLNKSQTRKFLRLFHSRGTVLLFNRFWF